MRHKSASVFTVRSACVVVVFLSDISSFLKTSYDFLIVWLPLVSPVECKHAHAAKTSYTMVNIKYLKRDFQINELL